MASIIERNGRFLVRVRRDGFKPIAKTFTRKSDGAAWARQVEAEMERGQWVDEADRVPTLKAAIAEYRVKVAVHMKGAADYAYRFDEFEAIPFAQKPVNAVTPFELAAWRDEQLAARKPATVVRKLLMLSAIFSWCAKERGWIDRNPVSLVAKPRVADSRDRTLTPEEVRYLLAAAATSKAAWLSDSLIVLMHSAMRRSELFGLLRRDVDFDSAVARLHDTKNGCSRDVPLCPQSIRALRALDQAAQVREGSSLLPIGAVGSLSTRFERTVLRARAAYEVDCTMSRKAGEPGFLSDLRLHDLRHHAVSMWANTGALSLVELMSISGHKTPRMLTRYVHMKAPALALKMAGLATLSSRSEMSPGGPMRQARGHGRRAVKR